MGSCFLYGNAVGAADGLIRFIVTGPSGATVTCTRDGETKHAAEQNGTWTFDVEPGAWTVNVELNGVVKSFEVDLEYTEYVVTFELLLYDGGDKYDATGGWERIGYAAVDPDGVYHPYVNIRVHNMMNGAYLTNNEIDLTSYSKLIYQASAGGVNYGYVIAVPADADPSTWSQSATVQTKVSQYNNDPNYVDKLEIDISHITGKHRLGIGVIGQGGVCNVYLLYMKLE